MAVECLDHGRVEPNHFVADAPRNPSRLSSRDHAACRDGQASLPVDTPETTVSSPAAYSGERLRKNLAISFFLFPTTGATFPTDTCRKRFAPIAVHGA